jgi:hypothetical protein
VIVEAGSGPHRMEADVCIVGAGIVGLAVARAVRAAGRSVIVVESGGALSSARLAVGAAGGDVVGDPRFGTVDSHLGRGFGGTAALWCIDLGATPQWVRLAVMEPGVLDRRPAGEPSWPFPLDDLLPWYEQALAVARCEVPLPAMVPQPSVRIPGVEESAFGFTDRASFELSAWRPFFTGPGADLLLGATVTGLRTSARAGGFVVDDLKARPVPGSSGGSGGGSGGGSRAVSVRASAFVLACGTVDVTRHLLELRERTGAVLSDAIGSHLMDRPRLHGRLRLGAPPPAWFAAFGPQGGGRGVRQQRLVVPRGVAAAGGASAQLMLFPSLDAPGWRRRAAGSVHRLAIDQPRAFSLRLADNLPSPIARVARRLERLTYRPRAMAAAGLRAEFDTEWFAWAGRPWEGAMQWKVTAMVEQFRAPSNRIGLSDRADVFGCRHARLEWGEPATVHPSLAVSLARCSEALEGAGLGAVDWDPELAGVSSCHMMGTVAIGDSPGSPAEPSGRVRGSDNLYVAGNAVIPRSGASNPTLTAMALGMRSAADACSRL